MKKIFTTCVLLIGFSIFAQEAGKAGELLKNEASRTEMQTRRSDATVNKSATNSSEAKRSGNVLDNSNYKNQGNKPNSNINKNISVRNYRWHDNYGNSEVFLRIPERGYFTVEIGEQMISNASGKFRFFDLNSGRLPISIYEDGYLVYRTRINVQNNRRLVLDFFSNQGLYLLDSYPVQMQSYGYSEWDDVWNNPYNNGGYYGNSGNNGGYYGNNGNNGGYYGNNGNGNGYGNYGNNVMNNNQFGNFMKSLQRNSFDDSKFQFIQQQVRSSYFTSAQIKDILSAFSFDKGKLEAGKMLYGNCVDKSNFYIVYEAFSFDSSRKELMKYVSNAR